MLISIPVTSSVTTSVNARAVPRAAVIAIPVTSASVFPTPKAVPNDAVIAIPVRVVKASPVVIAVPRLAVIAIPVTAALDTIIISIFGGSNVLGLSVAKGA